MGVLRLGICVGGVYAAFLLWAIAQEKLSTRFPSTRPEPHHTPGTLPGDTFPSPLFLNWAQALASCVSSAIYLLFTSSRDAEGRRRGVGAVLGLDRFFGSSSSASGGSSGQGSSGSTSEVRQDGVNAKSTAIAAQMANGRLERRSTGGSVNTANASMSQPNTSTIKAPPKAKARSWRQSLPALLLQVSLFQTTAGPIGFMALRHISYPTMVLGKSCKLIPVMLLNVLLYRRRFSAHKYVVVALVTVGISMFMLWAPAKKGKGAGEDSAWGLVLLLINLLIDGLTNSTQDQIFALYPGYGGQQMMFHMSLLAQSLLLPAILLPAPSTASFSHLIHYLPSPLVAPLRPHLPVSLFSPSPAISWQPPAAAHSIAFIFTHPTSLPPLLAYALLGGLGQLFIFETIQHFGSLTLTMVTVTRKLFTMLLSVFVFDHTLTMGQWAGVGVVFAGIGVEAGVKRLDVMRRTRRDK